MFDSEQVHYAPIEVPEKEKEPSAFSIHDLMTTHIAALFIKAGINDDFDKGRYSVHWKKMLAKEIERLSVAVFSDEGVRVDQVQRIQDKIAEINSYNRIDSNTHKKRTDTKSKERELSRWLRETWDKEGRPGGTAFFNSLKKYAQQKGSPIVEHYSAGKVAGFKWETSKGTTGEMPKKTLLNKVSIFKNTS